MTFDVETATAAELNASEVRRFSLVDPKSGKRWEIDGGGCLVGAHASNDVVLADRTVSRFHCEVRIGPDGARVRDLQSRNGTSVDGVRVVEAYLRNNCELRLGRAALSFQLSAERATLPIASANSFGGLVGGSVAMRSAYALLELAAASDSTVLIEGETGTGKEGAASALHAASARRDQPLVVVDCAALPANLIESELFGHERGAFTGASGLRIGAFEEASGGTVFLDEIGELPLDLQPKLLRVLESREIRRVGSNVMRQVDVRVIAATHRDLRAAVNQERFRPDLYFRLAVVRVTLPALRSRLSDLPALVEALLKQLAPPAAVRAELLQPAFLATLAAASWPGNVRELRNFLERCIVFQRQLPVGAEGTDDSASAPPAELPAAPEPPVREPLRGPFAATRRRALDEFERAYLNDILERHGGKVVLAAAEAGVDRVYLYRLLRKHGLNRGL